MVVSKGADPLSAAYKAAALTVELTHHSFGRWCTSLTILIPPSLIIHRLKNQQNKSMLWTPTLGHIIKRCGGILVAEDGLEPSHFSLWGWRAAIALLCRVFLCDRQRNVFFNSGAYEVNIAPKVIRKERGFAPRTHKKWEGKTGRAKSKEVKALCPVQIFIIPFYHRCFWHYRTLSVKYFALFLYILHTMTYDSHDERSVRLHHANDKSFSLKYVGVVFRSIFLRFPQG